MLCPNASPGIFAYEMLCHWFTSDTNLVGKRQEMWLRLHSSVKCDISNFCYCFDKKISNTLANVEKSRLVLVQNDTWPGWL